MISDAEQSEAVSTPRGVYDLLKGYLSTNGVVYLPAQVGTYDGKEAEVREPQSVSFKAVAELGDFDQGTVGFRCTSYQNEEVIIIDAASTALALEQADQEIPVLVLELDTLKPGKRGVTRAAFSKFITSGRGRSWLSFSQPDAPPEKKAGGEAEWKPPVRHKRDFVELVSEIDFENELNEEQLAAVRAPDGPTLVIAAAGTGKTRTLIYRLAYLATQKKVHPDNVLLLTFTNKAAREMLERTHQLVGNQFGSYDSGTFHSFANRVLRAGAGRIGFGRDFTILDSDDAKKLMRTCIDEIGVSKKHFPKPEVLLSLFGVVSGRMGDLTAAIDEEFEYSDVEADDVIKAHNLYQQKKKESNSMDFDDLLIYAHKLLLEHEDIRRHYQDEFKYVLVDEYQDTNAIQAELVHLLVQTHGNLMVVGDDFQSIYSWRGADFRNFLEFEKTYPGTQTFKLQTNYRSTPEILDVANEVIAGNPEQFQKELQAVRASDVRPKLVKVRDGSVQARYVIEKAEELRRSGTALSDMCVLYRSHFHAMELEMELNRAGMPYALTSGMRFFEKAHIKDVCTVLQLLVNPANELAFSRLVQLFPKVGAKTASKIFRKLGGRINLQRPEACAEVLASLPAAAREDWEKIQDIFPAYREENLSNDPGEIIFRFVKAFYKEYMVENFDNHKFRQEDIDGLIDFTVKFDSAESFLQEIALLTNMDAEGGNAPAEEEQRDSIRLSTVHQAKGLEWNVVFILFVNEDMFPSKKSVEEGGDAEERRLFYVAVTRAEDDLYICSPMVRRQRDGGMIFLDPSRFISEIPEDLLDTDGGGFY